MSKSDVGLLALNLITLLMAVVGLSAQHLDPMSAALALTLVTTLVNGGALLVRGRRAGPAAPRAAEADALDAHHILDLDGRLEALERAYGDANDAAKWRALVASGQASGPAAGDIGAGDVGRGHTRNGVS